jgi:hypothetical protein
VTEPGFSSGFGASGSPPAWDPPPPQPHRREAGRGRRFLLLLLVIVLVVAGAGAVWYAVRTGSSSGASSPPAAGPSAASPAPPSVSPDAQQVRAAALRSLLQVRQRAVLDHDRAAWLSTVDSAQTAFRDAQQAEFANLVKLPITRWTYTYDGPGPQLSSARRAALGAGAWVADVGLGYRFGAADRSDVHSTEALTIARAGGRWVVAGNTDGATDTEVWDLAPLTVVHGRRSVVIGVGAASTLRPFAAQADDAVARVSQIWGSAWPRRVVVLVPRTQAQMGRLLDRPSASLSQIAAVTTGELTAAAGEPAGGADQIIVNPSGFAKLSSLGRRVVITHETTHVAVRASTPHAVSIWLSEGFADYIGFSGLGLPRTQVAADVLGQVRRGLGPKHLPVDSDFDASQTTIGPSYSASWLACELIADRYGQAKLVALYRAASGAVSAPGVTAGQSPDRATGAAFDAVLGVSEPSFTKTWLRYLTSLSRQ